MQRFLIIEDDPLLRQELRQTLEEMGGTVQEAGTAADALELCRAQAPSLILLDIGLPDGDGFTLCRTLRQTFSVPILILTGFGSEEDILLGFQSGADDYVTKPCSLRVLQSRIRALLRRSETWDPSATLRSGDLVIDLRHQMIFQNGTELPVSRTEFELCLALLRQNGRILPREALLSALWDDREKFISDNTLSVHVSRLRKKLGLYQGAPYIETVKGIGYRWNGEVHREP